MGLSRRGPEESWNIARSTWQLTISPGMTWLRPAARAMSFWARVLAGVGMGLMVRVLGGAAAQPARFSLTEIVALLLPTCEISIWYS